MMTMLESLRDALADITGVQSCKIGLEDNISPDDYPIVRVVPSRLENGHTIKRRKAEVLIYFGLPIQPFDDTPDSGGRVRMEKLYAALFAMEEEIRRIVYLNRGFYRETITDEDRLDTYKLMAVRADIEG